MAKKSAKKSEVDGEVKKTDPFTQMNDIINSNDFAHYGIMSGNDLDNYEDEKISTGCARLDAHFGGGFRPGISLFFGDEETGKTAQGLAWGRQWQKKYGDKGWVVLLDAEGRLTKYKMTQAGINFDRFIWVRDNTAEQVFAYIDKLICNNPEGNKYFFIMDSLDAIMRKEDKEKDFSEPQKVAGSAAVQSLAGKKLSNPIHGFGHHLYMISQVRAKNIVGGGKGDGAKPSGGNAPKFYADVIGRMFKAWSDSFIKDGEKIIGNRTKIKFTKSYNEISNAEIEVPIKYKHQGGVWREYDAYMSCLEWSFINKAGSWFSFSELFTSFLIADEVDIDVSSVKVQGELKLVAYLESQPTLINYIESKIAILSA